MPQLRRNYGKYPGQLHVITVSTNIFDCLSFSEIVIYNPRMDSHGPTRVFLELPVAPVHSYWVEVVDEVAFPIVARVQQIIEKHPAP